VTADGTPQLLDFGIAKLLAPELMDQSVEETARFQRLLTPAYASPEQLRGDAVTTASDVYSLGVVLYRLLTGEHPYVIDEESSEEIERVVCEVVPVAPSRIAGRGEQGSLELDAVVLKALAKDPRARYASASALSAAIGELDAPSRPRPAVPATSTDQPTEDVPSDEPSEPVGTPEAPLMWGHLEIIQKLGEGQFGTVYKARDPALDKIVALKLFDKQRNDTDGDIGEQFMARILKEGQLLERVRHDNVVDVYGVGVHDDTVGLWMQHIPGQTLEDVLDQQGRYGPDEAIRIGVKLCGALSAVHQKGVIHRDIKIQNVMREEGGRIVLMDFGAGRDLFGTTSWRDAGAVGTPLYMAPEVLRGEGATERSDLYSLGVLLWHLVTKSFPYPAESVAELLEQHESAETPALRDIRTDVPARIANVIEKAIALDPAKRYASAGQMQRALEAAGDVSIDQRVSLEPDKKGGLAEDERKLIRRLLHLLRFLAYGFAAVVLVTVLGMLPTRVKVFSLAIHPDLVSAQAPWDHFDFGIRSLLYFLIFSAFPAAALATIILVAWLARMGIARWAATGGRAASIYRRLGEDKNLHETVDPKVLAASLLAFAVISTILVNVALSDMVTAFVELKFPSEPGRPLGLSVLEDNFYAYKNFHIWGFASLAVVLTFVAFLVPRDGRPREPAVRWMRAAIIVTVMLAVIMGIMTRQLLFFSKHPTICFENAKHYIVEASDSEYSLYSWATQDRLRVSQDDPRLDPESVGELEYIFGGDRLRLEELFETELPEQPVCIEW
ncbi:MAG: protein kinase, partial [Acidobacteria bacterium]|nr:protein kinase [Acidobacteriota bacterium]